MAAPDNISVALVESADLSSGWVWLVIMLSHSLLWQIQHATALQAKTRVNFPKAAKGRFNAVCYVDWLNRISC
ncbi:MAG: hypothetical protein CVV11_21165 [Gammaproteobacteria bacterium HGW-Gammaproteobacteria-15]|nr:MAG: hypothetical protein CVV11_21165 [Gammaproteobacteria bacterium HGW-Gammaproteobacteria-15]